MNLLHTIAEGGYFESKRAGDGTTPMCTEAQVKEKLAGMKIKEIKTMGAEHGVDFTGCLDKNDILEVMAKSAKVRAFLHE